MDNNKDKLIAWLNDAYAMEMGLIPILENHAKDAKDSPLIADRINQHIDETKRHKDLVASRLSRYGKEPSKVKGIMGKLGGRMQNVATGPLHDDNVKNAISDSATEEFEIASYRAIQVAAADLEDEVTVQACDDIIRDEEDMKVFLEKHIPLIVNEIMSEPAKK